MKPGHFFLKKLKQIILIVFGIKWSMNTISYSKNINFDSNIPNLFNIVHV